MKKILITGAGGFIGSHLAELCVEKGYKVGAFVRYNSRNTFGWLESSRYKAEMEIISGDIRDYDSVYRALKGYDTVFHLAALIGIPYSYISPLAYIKTNIEGTYNVLQSALELKLKNVLITSTSEIYGTAQYIPIDEKHPMVGQSPYSATKISADQLALSFYRSFGLPVKIVRPFNTYGPRQSARAIIPTIIIQLLCRKSQIKLGLLTPTRDFNYIVDVCRAFLAIAKADKAIGQEINISSGKDFSISELIKQITKIIPLDTGIKIVAEKQRLRPKKSEVMVLRGSNKKISSLTGWKPKYTLEAGLRETIEWIRNNLGYYKEDIYNV